MTLAKLNHFLVCPACCRPLSLKRSNFSCFYCHQTYPIKSGIPILLPPRLIHQELNQKQIFDQRYYDDHQIHPWHQSMIQRVFCHPFVSQKQLYLDLGCGPTGYTLNAAASRGLTAIGLELSLTAALKAKQQFLHPQLTAIIVGSISQPPFKLEQFNYISLISVLEHLKKPTAILNKINSLLKKSGHLFIVVPNHYSLIPFYLRPIKKYFDKKIGHLHTFSLPVLKKICSPLVLKHFCYNGHPIKFLQIILEKFNLIKAPLWWKIENVDINSQNNGCQLNALFQKTT